MARRAARRTTEVIIRGVKRSDVPALHEIMSSPNVIWGTTAMPCTSELAVEHALTAENRHWFIAASRNDDRSVGYLFLDWGQGRWRRIASLVMAVHDNSAGQGIGRKLLETAIHVGFQYLDLQRIELEVYVDNPSAMHLYQKVGFVHEGTKRRNAIREGIHVDGHMMAILKPLDEQSKRRGP
ncbi:GNAT family N-acetyltransferase [Hyalangium versicolor]|uniref:GNAT family N-acetyltransferase n=1 Tax=Hyalangium versicolor TaxID=2861190 RepID=UPI001CCA0FCB|nr:GNAT family N-acetyltransferase [Hyalangium versicolor]